MSDNNTTYETNLLYDEDGNCKHDKIIFQSLSDINFYKDESDFKHSLLIYLDNQIKKFDSSISSIGTFIYNYTQYFAKTYMTKENLYEDRFNNQSILFEDLVLYIEDTTQNKAENEVEYNFLLNDIKKQLAPKEWFVFKYTMQGYSQKELAQRLKISQQSISKILKKIKIKVSKCLDNWHNN